jgi:hypothetical protein
MVFNEQLITQILIALISTGLIPLIVRAVIDGRIESKLKEFTSNNCNVKHKKVDELQDDIKELKKSVNSIAVSIAKIETAMSIYFGIKKDDNE